MLQFGSGISVEAFLWHPHSIKYSIHDGKYAYNDQLLANMDASSSSDDDDDDGCEDEEEKDVLHIYPPPRMQLQNNNEQQQGRKSYDLQKIAEQWASRRRYRIVSFGHVIACIRTKKLLFIDFVMERTNNSSSSSSSAPLLACVYYAPCRGGEGLRIAREYMKEVQSVCNIQMNFFPQFLALCVYDSSELLRAASLFRQHHGVAAENSICSSSSEHVVVRNRDRKKRQSRKRRIVLNNVIDGDEKKKRHTFPKVYAMDVTLY
jgi:hypothetical protein